MTENVDIPFKATISTGFTKETRQFLIDTNSTSFLTLKEKLRTLFPVLQLKEFTIGFKDKDGDFILVSTDDEIKIAYSQMCTDHPRHFYITIIEGRPPTSIFVPATTTKRFGVTVHPGVTCDSCRGEVHGFRYKCTQCPDYDQCETCEGQGHHSHHNMLRISFPSTTPPLFRNNFLPPFNQIRFGN